MSGEYDYTKAQFYVVLKPDIRGDYVWGIKAANMTQGKPSVPRGHIVVKLNLRFLKAALKEAIPSIDVDVQTFGTAEPVEAVVEA